MQSSEVSSQTTFMLMKDFSRINMQCQIHGAALVSTLFPLAIRSRWESFFMGFFMGLGLSEVTVPNNASLL